MEDREKLEVRSNGVWNDLGPTLSSSLLFIINFFFFFLCKRKTYDNLYIRKITRNFKMTLIYTRKKKKFIPPTSQSINPKQMRRQTKRLNGDVPFIQ